MNEMNKRFKLLREHLDLKQEGLGNAIGLSKSGISNIENGTRNVTEQHIKLLAHEFNVNEEWLRHGQGEAFIESDSSVLTELSRKYKLDSLDMNILEGYLNLIPEERAILKKTIKSIANSIVDEEIATTVDDDPIEKELNAYRLELEAEQKGATSSALGDTKEKAN